MKMYKKGNSKKGFSLVEMIMVIAIICILASVVLIGGFKILNTVKVLCYGEDTPSISTHYSAARQAGN